MARTAEKKPDQAIRFVAGDIKQRVVDELKPYPRNPRTHPPDQIDLLAAMIKKYGFDQPIVVDEKDVILKGHGRRMAAIKLGMTTVPTILRAGLSAAEKRAMVIADNQVGLLSGWDDALLKLELGELKRLNYDLQLVGFNPEQLVSFLAPVEQRQAPTEFKAVGESIPTEHECPKCSYRWSGSSAPSTDK